MFSMGFYSDSMGFYNAFIVIQCEFIVIKNSESMGFYGDLVGYKWGSHGGFFILFFKPPPAMVGLVGSGLPSGENP